MSGSRVRLVRVPLPEVPWTELDALSDRTVFQTREWLDFLVSTQAAEPVVAQVLDGDRPVGWFTGAVIRHAGIRFLGSPLRGWTTSYMGFNLEDRSLSPAAMTALQRFAFKDLGCIHLELMDRGITTDPGLRGYRAGRLAGCELRIDTDDDALLKGMHNDGRKNVRRGLRNGITVEEVDPFEDPTFAGEYYAQVCESFAKRDLVPTYPVERVEQAVRHLHPAGRILLLRARDESGEPAATGIFPGLPGGSAIYWMGASHRDKQVLRPNEVLMWHALRAWRDRGAHTFDFGGGGEYKKKYGGHPVSVPWFRSSRFGALEHGRTAVQRAVRVAQRRAGRVST